MKKIRRTIVVLSTLLIAFAIVPTAFAHPLGNFTINQYVGLHISREFVQVDYVVDMAEIPAFQELAPFDSDRDRQPDLPAIQNYPADKCTSLLADLNLIIANQRADLTLTSSAIEYPVGVGGLPTIRLTCEFQAPFESVQGKVYLSFTNEAFRDRLGWKEVVVVADGVSLEGDFATESPSNRLTVYPQDLLNSPLDQRQAEIQVVFAGNPQPIPATSTQIEASSTLADRNDEFTRLILMEEITLPALLLALGISFVWGAMHAMTPGHGKTIVGAYLVGSRGTIKHAVYLGLTTTVTHTLGVFALGLVTLFAAQYIVPERLYPWMSLLSGLFVVGIGINLFASRFKSSGLGCWFNRLKKERSRLQPAFTSLHVKDSSAGHSHRFALTSSHQHSHPLSVARGHEHGHDHGHHHHGRVHADHSHTQPETITWRSLLALGVSGGLIPCPSALVVMLGAIALNRIGLGLILVLAFSLGLAGALTVIGMIFIYAGRLFERFPAQARIVQILPVISALFVSAIGVAISVKALMEMGLV